MAFYPISDENVIKFVRAILGGLTEEEMPDNVILYQWELEKELHTNEDGSVNEPLALYYTVYDLVQFYIIPQLIKNGYVEGSARSDKEGSVTVSETTGNLIGAWWTWLKEFEARPNIPKLTGMRGGFIIGGVSKKEFDRVKNDSDSLDGGVYMGQTNQTLIRCGANNFILCPQKGFYRC